MVTNIRSLILIAIYTINVAKTGPETMLSNISNKGRIGSSTIPLAPPFSKFKITNQNLMQNHGKKNLHMKIGNSLTFGHNEINGKNPKKIEPIERLQFHYPTRGAKRDETLYNAFISYFKKVRGQSAEPSEKLQKYFEHISKGYGEKYLYPSREHIQLLVYNDKNIDTEYLPKLFVPLNFTANILALGPKILNALKLKTENQKVDESDADAILQRNILEAVKMTIEYLEIERSAKRHIDEKFVAVILQGPLQLLGIVNGPIDWQKRASRLAPLILAAWEQNYEHVTTESLIAHNLSTVEQIFVQTFAKTNQIRLHLLSTKLQYFGETAEETALLIAGAILTVAIAPLHIGYHAILNYRLYWHPMIQQKMDKHWEKVQIRMAASYGNFHEIIKEFNRHGKNGHKSMHTIVERILTEEASAINDEYPEMEIMAKNPDWWMDLFVYLLNDKKYQSKIGNMEQLKNADGEQEIPFWLTIPRHPDANLLTNEPIPPPFDTDFNDYEYLKRRKRSAVHDRTNSRFAPDQFHSLIFGTDVQNRWIYLTGNFCPRGCKKH